MKKKDIMAVLYRIWKFAPEEQLSLEIWQGRKDFLLCKADLWKHEETFGTNPYNDGKDIGD